MAKISIRLPRGKWSFDDGDRLGPPGGFGEVFRGIGDCGPVAVKRLKVHATQAAHRELDVSEQLQGRELSHIVPVLDAGQDAQSDRYYLVMPICDGSLQDNLNEKGTLDLDEGLNVIQSILAGLREVADITHRDLKPGNVLKHEGRWKLADFGIAKFVEDSTSLETLRDCLTPAYAAPEQWLGERPTSATDVYALGCITHALLQGNPPFSGTHDELRDLHLNVSPPPLENAARRLSAFVGQMLRKSPAARPSLERCADVFSESDFEYKAAPRSAHALIEAASRLAETEARREAEALAKTRRKQERHALFRDAAADLENIKHRLYRQIQTLADGAEVDRNDVLRLGAARLQIGAASELEEGIARKAGIRGLNWDMLAWSIIGLGCQLAPHTEYAWTASLIYSDGGRGEGFRWSEVAFWSLGTVSNRHEPFAIKGTSPDLYLALGPVIHSVAPAYGPLAIDGEDEEAFEDRWINLFSKAVTGLLRRPQAMPIDLDSLLQS